MNSAINYLSASQLHADALRQSYRNPQPRPVDAKPAGAPGPRLRFLRAALLAKL